MILTGNARKDTGLLGGEDRKNKRGGRYGRPVDSLPEPALLPG
jgi:hypothetical protein